MHEQDQKLIELFKQASANKAGLSQREAIAKRVLAEKHVQLPGKKITALDIIANFEDYFKRMKRMGITGKEPADLETFLREGLSAPQVAAYIEILNTIANYPNELASPAKAENSKND